MTRGKLRYGEGNSLPQPSPGTENACGICDTYYAQNGS